MCKITTPMPYCEASVSSFNANFSLKRVKTSALDNLSLKKNLLVNPG